jgi:hypothetical protein
MKPTASNVAERELELEALELADPTRHATEVPLT